MIRITMMLLTLAALFGCGEPVAQGADARILVVGDSMFATNRAGNAAVADVLETELRTNVLDRSVIAARYFHALPISGAAGLRLTSQFREGDWDWVVMNGGGNDLLLGCGCGFCQGVLDRLVTKDGRGGAIPSYVARIRATGARVVYAGYMRNPGMATPIKHCGPAGNELDRRLTLMAGFDAGVTFVPMADLVPY
nr:SGNH/GDSL hydrolase family protein [Cypionkella sp.]